MTQPYDPNQASSGDLFSQADLNAMGSTELVAEGEYQLELTGRFNKKNGGIVFVEGKILAGPDAGKSVDLFSVVFHKKPGQRSIGLQNLESIGIDLASLNLLAKQLGASGNDMSALYEALAPNISGRTVNGYLVHNTFDGKNGEQTKMQLKIGEATLIGPPPAITVGAATPTATPQAVPTPAATPVPVPVTAPVVAPAPVVASAVEAAPAAVAPVVAAAPVVPAPAPVVAPAVATEAVPTQAPAAPVPVQPVAEAPALTVVPAPVAPAPVVAAPVAAPVAVAPAAPAAPAAPVAVPAPAPQPGTVTVSEEPGF